MTDAAQFAAKWHATLLSTQQVDRPAVEESLRRLYAAADFPEPQYFLWYDSPLAAIWAVTALGEGRDTEVDMSLPHVRQRLASRARHDEARQDVCRRLGAADLQEAQAAAGTWFHSIMSPAALAAKVMAARFEYLEAALGDRWMSHMSATDDADVAGIVADEKRIFGDFGDGILGYGAAYADGADIRHLMRTSAHARTYSQLSTFGDIARDEHVSHASGTKPPALIQAYWDVAERAGLWWPFEKLVILCERPTEVQAPSSDAMTMSFRDGFVAEPYRRKAKSKPAANPKQDAPAVLKAKLPAEHDARIAYLRKQQPELPHFERYLAGEHEQVWTDLVALGPAVRSEAHAADALAVAYETMHRVERNVRMLAERLERMGYRFVGPGGGGLLGALFSRPRTHAAHVPPGPDTAKAIAKLERRARGPIPLSLRAFWEVVGEVNFVGEHPALAPRRSTVTPDALVVEGPEGALDWLEGMEEEEEDERAIPIAPDALHKSDTSGGDPYMISVPAPVADAVFEEEPHGVNFVEYLRIAFSWGGFPGWEEGDAAVPPEIAGLREGLIAF